MSKGSIQTMLLRKKCRSQYKPEYADLLLKFYRLDQDGIHKTFTHGVSGNESTGTVTPYVEHDNHYPTLAGFMATIKKPAQYVSWWADDSTVVDENGYSKELDRHFDECDVIEDSDRSRKALLHPEWILSLNLCNTYTENVLLTGGSTGALNASMSKWLLNINHGYRNDEEDSENKIELHISGDLKDL